jgi:hypothetical protein
MSVVLLDGPIRGDAGKEEFPASGVPGNIVRLHRADDHQFMRVQAQPVYVHLGAITGCPQVDHVGGVAGIVDMNPIVKFIVQRTEDEPEFLLRRCSVGPRSHDESAIDSPYPLVEDFQNPSRGSGTGPIIDDEEHVPGVIEKLGKGGAFGRVFQSREEGLPFRDYIHLIGMNHTHYVLIWNVD